MSSHGTNRKAAPMKTYDLQVHTDASPCSRTPPATMVESAIAAGLDGIAITNHDTVAGVSEAREAAASLDRDLEIIQGVEVTTDQGHILGLDITSPPPQTDALSVIDTIHRQGGIAILSHPFDRLRQCFTEDLSEIGRAVDAVETVNSRCLFNRFNTKAAEFAATYELPTTGGSDAHFSYEVGRAVTLCDDDILDAIRNGTTQTTGKGRYISGHVATKVSDAVSLVR